jgi:hypothetical protein
VENPRVRYVVRIHEPSARQLPTDHDHEGGASRSSNISVINRRTTPPPQLTRSLQRINQKEKKGDLICNSGLAGSCHING